MLFGRRPVEPAKPVCRSCGQPHWNLVGCENAAEQSARASASTRLQAERYGSFSTPVGTRPWGNQLSTIDVRGGNVFQVRTNDDDAPEAA